MEKKEKEVLLEILELDKDASYNDIEKAYLHLVKLYSGKESFPLIPLENEFTESERKKILSDIKSAYEELTAHNKSVKEADFSGNEMIRVELPVEEEVKIEVVNGELFRIKREEMGLKIKDAAEALGGIPFKLISALESEKFSKFDDDGYLRWLVMKYAEFLKIDKKIAAEDYMKLYRSSK